jgi:hypothetical protein
VADAAAMDGVGAGRRSDFWARIGALAMVRVTLEANEPSGPVGGSSGRTATPTSTAAVDHADAYANALSVDAMLLFPPCERGDPIRVPE